MYKKTLLTVIQENSADLSNWVRNCAQCSFVVYFSVTTVYFLEVKQHVV